MLYRAFFIAICVIGVSSIMWAGAACDPAPIKDAGTEQPTTPDSTSGKLEPTLSSIEKNVFTPSCSLPSCHGGGAGGLTLKVGESHKNLVGVDSLLASGEKRVVAGDPDKSILFKVLKEAIGSIREMPPGAPISQEKMDVIREWIKQGAQNN